MQHGRRRQAYLLGTWRDDQFHRKPEVRANTFAALDADLTTHQLDQALDDRESEPGAAIAASGRGIDLAEGTEQHIHSVGWNPNSRITHIEQKGNALQIGIEHLDAHRDLASLRELDSIATQVQKNLPHTGWVTRDALRDRRVYPRSDLQILGVRLNGNEPDNILQHLTQIERGVFELGLACFDL